MRVTCKKGGVRERRPFPVSTFLCPTEKARNEGQDQQGEEDEEQNLRDTGRRAGNAAETKKTGDEGNNEKDQSIVEHFQTPSCFAWKTKADGKSSRTVAAANTFLEMQDGAVLSCIEKTPQPFDCGGSSGTDGRDGLVAARPVVDLPLGLLLREAIALLDLAGELDAATLYDVEIVIG